MDNTLEIKRAMETYFREQYELQERTIRHLESIEKQNKVLISIFGAAAKHLDSEQ
ncbi:hypothetical protein CLV78_105220 [Aliiruegeria haliotis]|uniref:Uncharacterized protein n=1 Tax=Aliiruegeria haliotis TaxID=1280846 RepID=A0A2T0RPQ5_9RHOB|nr:hypothetical protein CLV78_105220 [Aliiruegeria haliotis]